MEKVRFGIVGVGNIGSHHARNLLEGKIENGILAAICDLKPEKTDVIKALPGSEKVAVFRDYHEMLRSGLIDAVIVSIPHYFHPEVVTEALKLGLNAVSEKPAGVYTKQVREMNTAADEAKGLFTVMFNQRTNCVYRKMREMIQNGELGGLRRIVWEITDWYRSQAYYDSGDWRATWRGEGGGVLFNQCPHQIDLLQWIMGELPNKVHSYCHYGKWHDIEVEDDVSVYMEFPGGATGVFITSTADLPGTNRLEILGDRGKLVCDGKELLFYKLSVSNSEFNLTDKSGFGQPGYEIINVETDGKNPQHIGILNNFANAVLGLEPLFVKGQEGLNEVELMDAMELSGWLGREVTLPIDDDLYVSELQKRIETGRPLRNTAGVTLDASGSFGTVTKL